MEEGYKGWSGKRKHMGKESQFSNRETGRIHDTGEKKEKKRGREIRPGSKVNQRV